MVEEVASTISKFVKFSSVCTLKKQETYQSTSIS